MPNDNFVGTAWGSYRTSVEAIETAAGYNILSAVSTSVQSVIEAKVDNGPTNRYHACSPVFGRFFTLVITSPVGN